MCVAAAVIQRPDGSFLLGQRASDTFYPGYWEFPGGKCEPGEAPRVALVRELSEELGIEVRRCYPWIARDYVYPHAHVKLHFFRVTAWDGEITDHIHSALAWQLPGRRAVEPMLPANAPVLRSLSLPDFYGITHAGQVGVPTQLAELKTALAGGLKLVQVREPLLPTPERAAFAEQAVALCQAHAARVLINSDIDLAASVGADGVHLSATALSASRRRPPLPLVGASCHDETDLAHAASLGLDFVVLGAVKPTPSHPGHPGLGWDRFAGLIRDYPLPAYALGGLRREDLVQAWECGAHGVAALRAAWG